MKSNARILTAVLTAAVLTGIMTGCGSDAQPAEAQTQAAEAQTETQADEAEVAKTDEATEESNEEAKAQTEDPAAEVQEAPADEEAQEGIDYPSNFMEERTGKYSYDSEDEIINSLEAGEGYAYINVMGKDEPVLVITNEIFTPDENTANCLTCYPYFKNSTGKYICGSVFSTISTGTPIAVSDEGVVYCATHNEMDKLVFTEDGEGIMVLEYDCVEWGEDENTPNTYGGFVRETNSFDVPETYIAEDDSSYFDKAFEEYAELTPINFTVVE